ncbi:MAG: aspartate/glutamate racemase family protein [Anaerolineae bacterium]|nr:aspartate/glutamate racemase family protein [Anaerolineae bacterium]
MRRIGILGGMSPESTVAYYETITRTYTRRYGTYGYPEILIYSVSFQPYVDWPNQGRWDLVAAGLAEAAQRLEQAGADFVVIATNTMHIVVDDVRAAISIPVLSLLDVVGEAISERGFTTVGLLGTAFTMSHPLYQTALAPRGIEVLVPSGEDQALVHRVIYDELVAGEIRASSRDSYVEVVGRLIDRGAQGVILGCTEIPLLISPSDVSVPLFDTTRLHAEAALRFALEQ